MREPVEEPTEPLTDSERLLAAANACRNHSDIVWVSHHLVAAVLQAVADQYRPRPGEIDTYWIEPIQVAALALADDIRRYLK